jgi:hypothetical protein
MFKTRGDIPRLDLTIALGKAVKVVRGLRVALTLEERGQLRTTPCAV